jgi:hypothetical protein
MRSSASFDEVGLPLELLNCKFSFGSENDMHVRITCFGAPRRYR